MLTCGACAVPASVRLLPELDVLAAVAAKYQVTAPVQHLGGSLPGALSDLAVVVLAAAVARVLW